MSRVRRLWIVTLLSLWAVPANAAWSIGPNFGISILSPRGGGDALTTIAWPGSTGQVIPGFQPGLRIGVTDSRKQTEFYFDTGYYRLSTSGFSISSFEGTANFQYNINDAAATGPYVTAGAGVLRVSADGESLTNAIFGAGFGVRHRLKHGFGTLRGEAHFDSITEDSEGFPGGALFSLKVGFDLWMN